MKPIKDILVVTPDYPYGKESVYPFVQTICEEFLRKGVKVTILCPQSITSALFHKRKLRPYLRYEEVGKERITIYQPIYLTIPFKYHDINNALIRTCIKLFFSKHKLNIDAVYCHFWSSAYAALPFVKANNLPLFVATGESNIMELFSTKYDLRDLREYTRGVISVSSKNRDESIQLGLTSREKCIVLPNAINSALFYKRSREECRKELGFPQNAFIVAFVGWFIERKGPHRVASAIEKVKGVKSIFIGKGNQDPQCEGILFKGHIPHNKVPLFLNAADIFVLPTLHEGCCNAVVEAMACGLPIVSSNLSFNWDVLDENNSILIEPQNIDEIAKAIQKLKDNKDLQKQLSNGALKKASQLTIEQRAKSILKFMESRV